MRHRFHTRLAPGILVAVMLAACAGQKPSGEKLQTSSEPESKPVKMPPTNRKLGNIEGIAMDELFALQQSGGALVYDVRLPVFYATDHMPGAVNWPHTQYDSQGQARDIEIQKALAEGKKVVLYCFNLGCPEARNVAKKLARRDYTIHVFGSGIDSWREAGLPLEQD